MSVPITSVAAALLCVLFITLTLRIISMRRRTGISLGVGESEGLVRAVRSHANFAEYTPLFLVMLLLIELQQALSMLLVILAAVFITGRIAHAIGFGIIGRGPGRVFGMVCTNLVLLVQAVVLAYLVVV